MNPRKTYNQIIDNIEELVKEMAENPYENDMSSVMISETAFLKAGYPLSNKQRNVLFNFLLGETTPEYVDSRRMNAICAVAVEHTEEKWKYGNHADAISTLAGQTDQTGVCKKFKKFFGVPMCKLTDNPTRNWIKPPAYWETLGEQETMQTSLNKKVNFNEKEVIRFGVPAQAFDRAKLAESLQKQYSLPDLESDLAFSIAESQKTALEEAFEYVYNYSWYWMGAHLTCMPKGKNENLVRDLTDKDVIKLYFSCGLGFNDICRIMTCKTKNLFKKPLEKYDLLYLKGRFYNQISEKTYNNIYKWYQSNCSPKGTAFQYCLFQFLVSRGLEWPTALQHVCNMESHAVNDLVIREIGENIENSIQNEKEQEYRQNCYADSVPKLQMERYEYAQWDESDDDTYVSDYAAEGNQYDEYGPEYFEDPYYDDADEQTEQNEDAYYCEFNGIRYDLNDPTQFAKFCEDVDAAAPDTEETETKTEDRRMTLYSSVRSAEMADEDWLNYLEYSECNDKDSFSTFGFSSPAEYIQAMPDPSQYDQTIDGENVDQKTEDLENNFISPDDINLTEDMEIPF